MMTGSGDSRRGPPRSAADAPAHGARSTPATDLPREDPDRAPADDPRAAALAILGRQRKENPARFALGLTTALVRETDPARGAAVRQRIAAFVDDLDSKRIDVVPGSALDQWRVIARNFGAGPPDARDVSRLRELTVPLGQAALAADRVGAARRPDGPSQPRPAPQPRGGKTVALPQAVWLDPRRPEQSKGEIAEIAGRLDDAGLVRLHAATAAAVRAPTTDLAGDMRRSGYQRAASELAQIARTRGLALDNVESDRAKRKAQEPDLGR